MRNHPQRKSSKECALSSATRDSKSTKQVHGYPRRCVAHFNAPSHLPEVRQNADAPQLHDVLIRAAGRASHETSSASTDRLRRQRRRLESMGRTRKPQVQKLDFLVTQLGRPLEGDHPAAGTEILEKMKTWYGRNQIVQSHQVFPESFTVRVPDESPTAALNAARGMGAT